MSRQRVTNASPTNPRRKQIARNTHNRERKTAGIATGIGVLAILGVVLGLHFSSTPSTASSLTSTRMGSARAVGLLAPDGTVTTTSGRQLTVASLRGKPTLLWFVTTWCPSCQSGTHTMAQNISRLQGDGVRVVEVELYRDLGQSGPSITAFGRQLAGAHYGKPNWTFATSSPELTRTYDPGSYLDIYYLLNSKGQITYVNGSPSSTMPNLLAAASKVA